MKFRFLFILLLCVVSLTSATSQVRLNPYYPYSNWSVGAGVGFSEIYGNLSHPNSEPVFRFSVERNTNMWVNFALEVQRGALSDYEVKNAWTNGLSTYNQFTSVALKGRVSLGEFFKYPKTFLAKTLFGLYAGVGGGYMTNKVSNVTLKFKHLDKYKITDFNSSNIKTESKNYFLPFSVGFNLHMTKRVAFNINYDFNYAFSDYLDGYNFQAPIAKNKYNDMFSVLSFGLNIYVGKISYHYLKYGKKK